MNIDLELQIRSASLLLSIRSEPAVWPASPGAYRFKPAVQANGTHFLLDRSLGLFFRLNSRQPAASHRPRLGAHVDFVGPVVL
jgi:hypothetical protein